MGKRLADLVGKRSMFIGIAAAVLFGLATILITPASPALASMSPALVAPAAAAPCVTEGMRYVDCGNGTVTDTVTGLVWLKQSDCLSTSDWESAKKAAAGLKEGDCKLSDGSSAGDWRLPTQAEWEATMKNALSLGCTGPTLTNDAGNACISAGPTSFIGVESDYYWSGTTEGEAQAYIGDIDHGHLLKANLINTIRVWPVRGGKK